MPVREEWANASDDLTAQVDGVKDTFTTSERYRTGSLRVFINGDEAFPSAFTESTPTTFKFTAFVLKVPDTLVVWYIPY
jgi:hypothetical protein